MPRRKKTIINKEKNNKGGKQTVYKSVSCVVYTRKMYKSINEADVETYNVYLSAAYVYKMVMRFNVL